jgi:hypothetical protein
MDSGILMLLAVDLDYQSLLEAAEVRDEFSDRKLAAKLVAGQAAVADYPP